MSREVKVTNDRLEKMAVNREQGTAVGDLLTPREFVQMLKRIARGTEESPVKEKTNG